MKNGNVKNFFAAFTITCILIGAFFGFAAVDLSTDRYMPGQFGPFFEINKIKYGSVEFSFLAESYVLDTNPPEEISDFVKKYRGLLPVLPQIFSGLTAQGISNAAPYLPNINEK